MYIVKYVSLLFAAKKNWNESMSISVKTNMIVDIETFQYLQDSTYVIPLK